MIDVSLSDKGKSEILEKFGEYTPNSIKKYLIEEKGAGPKEAETATKEIKKAFTQSNIEFKFNKALPWAIGGIAALLFLRILGGKK